MNDADLLRRYAEGDQEAFADLVRRHVDLVYSVARRQLGSTAFVDDVCQLVFLDLAKQCRRLDMREPLVAWLYVVARRTAIDTIRAEGRRKARERVAAEMNAMNTDNPYGAIDHDLDDAISALPPAERAAVILRFFHSRSLTEVGQELGATENAAQKRIARALERLRLHLASRGVPLGATSLAAGLAARAVETAPAGLSASIAASVGTAAAMSPAILTLAMTTLQKTVAASLAAAAIGAGLYQAQLIRNQKADIAALERKLDASEASLSRARQQTRAEAAAVAASSRSPAAPEELLTQSWQVRPGMPEALEQFLHSSAYLPVDPADQMARVRQTYGAFAENLSLSPESAEKLMVVLDERLGRVDEIYRWLKSLESPPGSGRPGPNSPPPALFRQAFADAQVESVAMLKEVLGDEGWAKLQRYDQTTRERDLVGALNQQLAGSGLDLSPEQSNQLGELLLGSSGRNVEAAANYSAIWGAGGGPAAVVRLYNPKASPRSFTTAQLRQFVAKMRDAYNSMLTPDQAKIVSLYAESLDAQDRLESAQFEYSKAAAAAGKSTAPASMK